MQTAVPGLTNRRQKIALIHVAKRRMSLADEDYRALLEGAADVSSAAEITTDDQFNAVMDAFAILGFVRHTPLDNDLWGGTGQQRTYIEGLWRRVSRTKTKAGLYAFIRRTTGVDHPRFLTRRTASAVITGLLRMQSSGVRRKGEKARREEGSNNALRSIGAAHDE